MLLVVADTSPIRYLVQIGHIDLLPRLFEKVLIPGVVADELRHPSAPQAVQSWMGSKAKIEGLGVTSGFGGLAIVTLVVWALHEWRVSQ